MSDRTTHLLFTGLAAGNIGDEAMFSAFLNHYRLPHGSTVEVYDSASPVIETFPRHYRYVDRRDERRIRQAIESSQNRFPGGRHTRGVRMGP